MKSISFSISAAAALVASAAGAQTPDSTSFSVRNDSGGTLLCMIKANGSASTENMTIRAGGAWTKSYKAAKDRRIRCEGPYSAWQRISPGTAYALRRNGKGAVIVAPAAAN